MNEIILISGMALVTWITRYPAIGMSGQIKLSPRLLQLLRYVPPTVLTAIVVPEVLIRPENDLFLSLANPRLVGAIAAILVGFWRKNLLLTIVVGMATFLVWQTLSPFS